MAAARRIVACDGPDSVTLSRAADEAGFARATVYGHFRNKEELLVSVIADDMATLGRMMREAGWDAHSEAASAVDPQPMIVPPANDAPSLSEHAKEVLAQEEALPAEPQAVSEAVQPEIAPIVELPGAEEPSASVRELAAAPRVSIRRADIRAVLSAQDTVQTAPEAPSAGSEEAKQSADQELPRVDAWLERRLRVFERSLADIEARLEKAERSSERAQALVAEGMRDVQLNIDTADRRQRENIDSIIRHTEVTEQRVRSSIVDLRSMLNDAFVRAEIQDTANSFAEEKPHPEDDIGVFVETPQPSTDLVKEEPRPSAEPSQSFLAAARRAANVAAQLAEAEQSTSGPMMGGMKWAAGNEDRRKLYTRYLMYGVALLVLVLVAAGMVLRHDAANAKPVTVIATAHNSPVPPKRHALIAPTDRLSVLANAGDAKAELVVGLRYLQGAQPNPAEAAYWLQRAADAHEPLAQYYLGTLYDHGQGVTKDAAKAAHWYVTAAGGGNRKAMQRLGVAYAEGLGVKKDLAESARWFTMAANAGLIDAQFNLAVLYERGQGVPQSLLDAYKWYAIASAQGDAESRSRVEALATQLSPDDMTAAERAVQAFVPTPVSAAANVAPGLAETANAAAQ